ncbi:MAG: hypothetical protein QNJ31_08575 [Candidatus Caenarcaniphilales bacterium]|nr:hypothetical protein [Candidatus Caenarcaniphilales bacterium]
MIGALSPIAKIIIKQKTGDQANHNTVHISSKDVLNGVNIGGVSHITLGPGQSTEEKIVKFYLLGREKNIFPGIKSVIKVAKFILNLEDSEDSKKNTSCSLCEGTRITQWIEDNDQIVKEEKKFGFFDNLFSLIACSKTIPYAHESILNKILDNEATRQALNSELPVDNLLNEHND